MRPHPRIRRSLPLAAAVLLLALPPSGHTAPDVVSIWGGARGTIVLKSDGTVWTWGGDAFGKLGINQTNANTRALVPVEVHGANDIGFLHSVTTIMGGETHYMAVKSDGTLWSWGYNFIGELGDGTTNDAAVPIQAGLGANPPLTNVIKLGGRTYFSLAVKADGSIWGWGMNWNGQMGNGTIMPTGPQVLNPVMVSNSQPGHVMNNPVQVSCGYTYGLALLTNGSVWTWGTGVHGELGADTNTQTLVPIQVPGVSNITAISSGWKHTLALKSDGTVWSWGLNGHGELGDGTSINRSNAVQVLNLSNIVMVSGGDYNSIALRSDGTVWKWGLNDVGELGQGTNDNTGPGPAVDLIAHPFPVQVTLDKFGNAFSNVVMVSNRDYHNMALKSDGSMWMWGANDQGQCGDGTTNDIYRPSPVVGIGPRVPLSLMIKPSQQPGAIDLTWSCNTGEYYAVEYSTNLSSGFNKLLQTDILATPPTTVFTVGKTNVNGYYRLRF
jgi:alpha-tubulin suppressor-like RCC1 family protein